MAQVKFRKCPECGSKMVLRKSHTKGTKFWGCTMWKETECNGSAPYFGDGARAGLILDIREIENGYVITTAPKYADNAEEDDPVEQYVKDREELNTKLKTIFEAQAIDLCKRIEDCTEFVDEIDQTKHKERVKVVKQGTTNVDELIKRMALAKAKAALPSAEMED